MLIEESRRRQEELENSIYEMAKFPMEEDGLREIAVKLKGLYTNNFRHSYSQFYPLIIGIAKEEKEYNLDFLSENLENIRILVEKDYFEGEKEFKGLYNPLSKLSDHLNLEIARYNHYTVSENSTKDILQQNKKMENTLQEAQKALDDSKKRAENMQTEYTTILGIFAAIILAFTGTITFSSSVLENIHQSSIYRLIIITLIIGFVAFNIIAILIEFIVKINKKELLTDTTSKSGFMNTKVIAFDIIVIIGIVITCLAYRYDWFEKKQPTENTKAVVEQQYETETEDEAAPSESESQIQK